jgi:hypothetical protein
MADEGRSSAHSLSEFRRSGMGQGEILSVPWLLTLCASGAFLNCLLLIATLPHCRIAALKRWLCQL